jgi:hypothetical protein
VFAAWTCSTARRFWTSSLTCRASPRSDCAGDGWPRPRRARDERPEYIFLKKVDGDQTNAIFQSVAQGLPHSRCLLHSCHRPCEFLRRLGGGLAEAGVTLLEYRNKTGAEAELLADAEILRAALPAGQVKLILDDRADLIERLALTVFMWMRET